MKKMTRLCLTLFAAMSMFMMCSISGHAAQGFLKDVLGSTMYLAYGDGGDKYDGFGFDIQEGDQVTCKALTSNSLKVDFVDAQGTWANVSIKMKKAVDGKVQVNVKRGSKTYSKTIKIKWFKKPTITSFKLGSKDYTVVFENTEYFEVHNYLKGKLNVKAPSGWFLQPRVYVEYKKGGKIIGKDWYIGRELPENCIRVAVRINNKKNVDLGRELTLVRMGSY